MTTPTALRPARRFLHVCYCSSDFEPVTKFFVDAFGMRNTMTASVVRGSGAVLGFDGDTTSGAAFVYDPRGPRVSPALEIQAWLDPPLTGTPPTDPTAAGIHALGVAVPHLDVTVAALTADFGCTVIGCGHVHGVGDWVTVRDPRNVTIDLVESAPAGDARSQLRHLRMSVTDLDTSIAWLDGLGFDVIDRAPFTDAAVIGVAITESTAADNTGADGANNAAVDAELARLRLPDEPFELVLIQWNTPKTHGRHVEEPNTAGLFRAALGVDDTPAAYEALKAAGWEFERAPITVPLIGTPIPELTVCFLNDPDGIAFEFVQRPRSIFR